LLVVNTQPFDLVYTLVNHTHLGYLLEPHVVQVNGLGNFTLTHQRVFSKTAGYFAQKISEHDMELIRILDEVDDDFLFRKYYVEGKKKIRTAEFFDKYCTEELMNEQIRPFVEQKMNTVLQALRGKTVYKTGNDNNPTSVSVEVAPQKRPFSFISGVMLRVRVIFQPSNTKVSALSLCIKGRKSSAMLLHGCCWVIS
jgi:hypothetical protein